VMARETVTLLDRYVAPALPAAATPI
jgi:hypothetical protein